MIAKRCDAEFVRAILTTSSCAVTDRVAGRCGSRAGGAGYHTWSSSLDRPSIPGSGCDAREIVAGLRQCL
jgi:hypothetical protein